MNLDKNKLIQALMIIFAILIVIGVLTQINKHRSKTLYDYALENPDLNYQSISKNSVSTSDIINSISQNSSDSKNDENEKGDNMIDLNNNGQNQNNLTENLQNDDTTNHSTLVGAMLNGDSKINERMIYADNFYFEPISDKLKNYITGVSFPADNNHLDQHSEGLTTSDTSITNDFSTIITIDDLRYVHVMHYDFAGNPSEGELICNKAIAKDLVEIFYELYENEYQIEKILLIDEYNGDDVLSMADNNSSCFNFRYIAGTNSVSNHAYGLAIDINPLYNPYITYNKNGTANISPIEASPYADRTLQFPYKIDTEDLCYKLFKEHGFTWGGNWNSSKDYQHFQKTN